ncbi:MAG: ATP-binding protein [Firmicutes bacterium]|nr:ATP-binding protein [Bacillota bacterium]
MGEMFNNPFTPNFGQVPQIIAGRDQIIMELDEVFDGALGSPARTTILIGARGSGKTAMLSYFAQRCRQKGWISVSASCIAGIQEDILQQAAMAADHFTEPEHSRRLTGVSLGQFLGISWENVSGFTPNWRTRMTALLDVLAEQDIGLFLTIDEIDPHLEEMIQIASVYQLLVRENRKVALLMAGLPSEVSGLLNDRSVSFLRRASQHHLGRIADHEVTQAFRHTIESAGKQIEADALADATKAIDGFPYMLQLVGFRSWQGAGESAELKREHVRTGIEMAQKDFENRVLLATMTSLSRGDKTFLRAMLPDAGRSSVSDIEQRLDKSSGYVSRYRGRLIESGVIEQDGRGWVRFALPGLQSYLKKTEE